MAYLEDLLRKVSQDDEWLAFVRSNSAKAVFYDHDEFTALVDRDSEDSVKYLRMAKILASDEDASARRIRVLSWWMIPLTAAVLALVLAVGVDRRPTGVLVVAGVVPCARRVSSSCAPGASRRRRRGRTSARRPFR